MKFWLKRLIKELTVHPLVQTVRLRSNRVSVKYTTGFRRNYVFGKLLKRHIYRTEIVKQDGIITNWIKIGYQFQWKSLNRPDLAKYFLVKREAIEQASYIEKEVLVHDLMTRIKAVGVINNYYDNQDLLNDLERIREQTASYRKGEFSIFPSVSLKIPKPGRPWVETYFDINCMERNGDRFSTLTEAFIRDRALYVTLQKLIRGTKQDITIATIRNQMHNMGFGPTYVNPIFYRVFFKQFFKSEGRIITDLDPHLGSKAIAAKLTGAYYNPIGYFPIEMAADLCLELRDPGNKHDIVIVDNRFKRVNIDEAMLWRSRCNELILFIEHDQLDYARVKYKPTQIVKVRTKAVIPLGSFPNYIFIFKDKNGASK